MTDRQDLHRDRRCAGHRLGHRAQVRPRGRHRVVVADLRADAVEAAVAPGFVETPILATIPEKVMQQMKDRVPPGCRGRPEEVANVYAFLASDEASCVNGAVIEVADGMSL